VALFQKLTEAYEILNSIMEERQKVTLTPTPRGPQLHHGGETESWRETAQ
jgi:hypothetical protein